MPTPDLSDMLTASATLRAGGSWRRLAGEVAEGLLVPVHRGWYVARADESRLHPEQRHHLQVLAVARKATSPNFVFSHTSAAVLWGLPLYRFPWRTVHTTLRHGLEVHSGGDVRRHRDALSESAVTEREGLVCTTLERTVVDVARTSPLETAVAAADAAMRHVAWDQLRRRYDRTAAEAFRRRMKLCAAAMTGRRGIRQARRVIDVADGRAQLPGESVSRLLLAELGFTRVRLQVAIPGPTGRDFAVDFGLDDVDAWGEFDGIGKYVDPELAGASTPTQVLRAEKEREDWIRATTGRPVARWGSRDIASATTLRQALARHGIRPPRERAQTARAGTSVR